MIQFADISRGFDPYRYGNPTARHIAVIVLEGLGIGDRTKGPGGTNEWQFTSHYFPVKYTTGALAESWELSPDGLNYTFHLRKGIRWQNKPPVNGREFVASDVKYVFDRRCGLGDFTKTGPSPYYYGGMESIKEVTTPDKYTVVLKCSKFEFSLAQQIMADYSGEMYPPECISLPKGLDDWRNLVGTGSFILTDYVPGSALTFKRNPDYWGYDEFHPENRLPYYDEYRDLIIPDASTRVAAIRAGRAETIGFDYVDWRTGESLKKINPELQLGNYDPGGGTGIFLQHDIKPFDDLRVRKALQMSLDLPAIAEIFGPGGRSDRYCSVLSTVYGPDLYTPYEELPKSVQENLTYNPEKAKQLLAEAGYPNGFKMETCVENLGDELELAQLAADYLGRIGIQAELQPKEPPLQDTLWKSATYRQTIVSTGCSANTMTWFPYYLGPTRCMRHNDQVAEDMWAKAKSTVDTTERNKLLKALNVYFLENVFYIGIVSNPPTYQVAQPWVRGWHGENTLKPHQPGSILIRLWLDLDMKEAITGRR